MVMKLFDVVLEFFEVEVEEGAPGVEDSLFVGATLDLLLNVFEEEWAIFMDEATHDLLADVSL